MKEALATHAEYHRGLEPKYKKISLDDLENELPFSSLSDIAAIIDQLSAEMSEVGQRDKTTELRVMELQSRMLKSEYTHMNQLTFSRHESKASREIGRGA
jgi:hypothetical protein